MSTKRHLVCNAAMLAAALLFARTSEATAESVPRLRVVQQDGVVWIRSTLSPTRDLVVLVSTGENHQINFDKVFVSPTTPGMQIVDLINSLAINPNSDDSTPWNLNGTYIGANHGCSDSRILTSAKHGLAVADLGSEWLDEAGTRFYVLKIPDGDHLWVLSANTGAGDVWRFAEIKGSTLKRPRDGAALAFTVVNMVQ